MIFKKAKSLEIKPLIERKRVHSVVSNDQNFTMSSVKQVQCSVKAVSDDSSLDSSSKYQDFEESSDKSKNLTEVASKVKRHLKSNRK